MEKIALDGPKAPIGFLSSVWKGIGMVNSRPDILILPVLLDSFLWFGPHLSVYAVVKPFIDYVTRASAAGTADAATVQALHQAAADFNLFSLLSFVPLFPPSLMSGTAPTQTPLGNPIALTTTNGWVALGLAFGLILLSVLIGSAYWVWAGRAAQESPWPLRAVPGRWARTVLVMALLGVSFAVLILAVSVPAVFVISLIAAASGGIGSVLFQVFFFLGGGLLFWIVLFFMFSMHGTVLYGDGVVAAIGNSVNTSRWMYPLSIWIPILLILLSFLSTSVWSLAPTGSWTGMVGVLGNAYTSSVAVTASMAYYIDKRRWINEVRTYLQSRVAEKIPPPAA